MFYFQIRLIKKYEIKENAIDIQENYLYLKQKEDPCFILGSINKNSLGKKVKSEHALHN